MIATIVLATLIALAFGLAVRRVLRRGACAACEQGSTCASAGSGCSSRTGGATTKPVDLGMPGGLSIRPRTADDRG